MYLDFNKNDIKAVGIGATESIPVIKKIIATCTNFSIPESRRIQACLTNSVNIFRVVTPMVINPETKEAERAFWDELPKCLSTLYTECIEYREIRTQEELTKNLLWQKGIEEGISRCLSKAEIFVSNFPQLVEIIVGKAPFEKIRIDLIKILVQFNAFRTACDLPLPEIAPRNMSLKQCLTAVRSLFLTLENLSQPEINPMEFYFGVSAFYKELPSVLYDCGMLGLDGEL